MASPAKKLVGIDLGTTFSAIATLDDRGQAVTLPNLDGEMLTPSAILLEGDNVVIGQAARDVALEAPDRVALFTKRFMGHSKLGSLVDGKQFRPETLSALILRKLIQDAELRIGKIDHAVITVPAYFDDTRRKATKDAGRIAGIDVIDILDEPTAAALAYGFQSGSSIPGDQAEAIPEQTVLVYDLGGGTFDVTLVRLSHRRFETLGIEGDVRLGGNDWDDRLIDYVGGRFQKQFGEDPRGNPISKINLSMAAERAKRTLSKLQNTSISCTHAGKQLTVPLSRTEFEILTRDLLARTRFTTQQLLQRAKMKWEQVDRVLMVGGSTHMPMTGAMLEELSGKKPDKSLAVSEVVARGAAIHAGIVSSKMQGDSSADEGEESLADIVEINVNSHSLGIEIKVGNERLNDILIPKNTQLPTSASRVYRTVVDSQSKVRVKVLQGEAPQADLCISIGECWVDKLTPHLPKLSPIQVTCGVGSNGLVEIEAVDLKSGQIARTQIHRSSGLSDEQITQEAEWVRTLKIQ